MKTLNFKETPGWITLAFAISLLCITVSFAQATKESKVPMHTMTGVNDQTDLPGTAPAPELHLQPIPLHVLRIITPFYHADTVAYPDPGPPKPENGPTGERINQGPGMGVENEMMSSGNLKIYPNPTSGQFTLNFNAEKKGDLKVRILDITGKEIAAQQLSGFSGNYNNLFDLSDQGKGLYIVSIEMNKQLYTKKVIID